jgi:hypothetical protein
LGYPSRAKYRLAPLIMETPTSRQFFFCHIPKTAGTTFGRILSRNFGRAFYSYYGLWDERCFTRVEVAGMCELHPQYRCIASHMFSLDLPETAAGRPVQALAFVRHPLERVSSLYFYDLQLARENGVELARDPRAYFEQLVREKRQKRFFNGQTRHLLRGVEQADPLAWLRGQCTRGQVLLLPVEHFSKALLLLEKLYPRDFPNTAFTGKLKTTARPQEIPDELLQEMEAANAEDMALYHLATESFDHLVQENLGGEEEIAALAQAHSARCETLRQRENKEAKKRQIHDLLGKVLARW